MIILPGLAKKPERSRRISRAWALLAGCSCWVAGERPPLALAGEVVAPGKVRQAAAARSTADSADPAPLIRLVNAWQTGDLPSAIQELLPTPADLDRPNPARPESHDPELATLDALAAAARPIDLAEAITLAFRR